MRHIYLGTDYSTILIHISSILINKIFALLDIKKKSFFFKITDVKKKKYPPPFFFKYMYINLVF